MPDSSMYLIININMSFRDKERLYKVCVLGGVATGKDSFLYTVEKGFVPENRQKTGGIISNGVVHGKSVLKIKNFGGEMLFKLRLDCIPGNILLGKLTTKFYENAYGAFVVASATKKDTFDKDGYLYNKIDKVVYKPLVGVSAMYALSNDYGVELGVDTFNKVTVGFTVLF